MIFERCESAADFKNIASHRAEAPLRRTRSLRYDFIDWSRSIGHGSFERSTGGNYNQAAVMADVLGDPRKRVYFSEHSAHL